MTNVYKQSSKISSDPIRISLFRVHPAYEEDVLDRFEAELSGDYVAFKALGHFDIIVIYKGTGKSMLFSGAIPGIRSFSNIDCVFWEKDKGNGVLEILKNSRVIALNLIALHSDIIKEYGGIHSQLFNDSADSLLHLNSLTWGEQVIIFTDNQMKKLTDSFQKKLLVYTPKFIDIHTLLGVNMEEVKKIDNDELKWEEKIPEDVSLKWVIDLECKSDAEEKITKALSHHQKDNPYDFKFSGPRRSYSKRTLVYDLKVSTWKFVIKSIRDVRKAAGNAFSSTKLLIRTEGAPSECNQESLSRERFQPQKPDATIIDKKICEKIRANMGDDVGRQVIQAVYTVLDTASDSPSDYAVNSLMPAVKKLIERTTELEDQYREKRNNALPKSEEDQRKQARLMEAERLMTATRQRLAGMPITREFSRLPFELPPPGPRLYYEAAEHVADAFLRTIFAEKFPPYVLIDTGDSPQFGGLAIWLPHRQLLVPRMYEAITHESLHHYIQKEASWREKILGLALFSDFYENGRILSNRNHTVTEVGRYRLIEDIVVESLDFIFSYLEDIQLYMEEEWVFFARGFEQAVKTLIGPETLLPYVLRTFAVKLQHEARKLSVPAQGFHDDLRLKMIVANPHKLRNMLRWHLEEIQKTIESLDPALADRFPPGLVVDLQYDIEKLEKLLSIIFTAVNSIRDKKSNILQQMKKYRNEDMKNIVDGIMEQKVVCEPIPFPHLVINGLCSRINREGITDRNNIEVMAKAMIMCVWNSSQLDKCVKAEEKENEE